MILIVAEKAIAGQRISSILAGHDVPVSMERGAKFFSFEQGDKQFITVPLRGHVVNVDFPTRYAYWIGTDLRILAKADVEYKDSEKPILDFLRDIAKDVDQAIIATDNDREGESIGFEAINALKDGNSEIKVKRALFSAITPVDIESAFDSLVDADENLSDSADSRREIDLVWGAVLTRFLSIVSGRMGKEFLSMGRVQGPTLALIVNREKERLAFDPKKYWELAAVFSKDKSKFEASHKNGRFWDEAKANKAFDCKKPPEGKVTKVTKKKRVLKKPLPFNTTSFLTSATSIGFTAGRAMQIAESLYQSGFISYPRTDNAVYPASLNLKEILTKISRVAELKDAVNKVLALDKIVPSKGKSTKDHPPIHPVSAVSKQKLSPEHWKVYELVCRRFLATLAEDAITENLSVEIDLNSQLFVATGQVFVKKAWKELYPYSKANEVFLPPLSTGDAVALEKLDKLSKQTTPKPRYSQGSLIKKMSELNLGTKSTRAEIIQKLLARKYIFGKKALEPNKVGFAVIEAIEEHSPIVSKSDMTARIEKEMDLVAEGKKTKEFVVNESRNELSSALDKLLEHKADVGSHIRKALRSDSILGECSAKDCDGELLIRRGRASGKRFLGCSNYPKCTNTFPLPQKGPISPLPEKCSQCGNLMIHVGAGRRRFKMCIDHNCPSKEEWKKRAEAKDKKSG
ncbi:MAG: DNA topoisomerase I [archaeon]|nr:DNA topoisomerase I [archaeon]